MNEYAHYEFVLSRKHKKNIINIMNLAVMNECVRYEKNHNIEVIMHYAFIMDIFSFIICYKNVQNIMLYAFYYYYNRLL